MGTQIQEYSRTRADLAELHGRLDRVVYDVSTTAGMDRARKDRAEVRTVRVGLEKIRVKAKAAALEHCRLVDAEAKALETELRSIEDPIDTQIKAEEEWKAAEKAKREQQERDRVTVIRGGIDTLRSMADVVGFTAARIMDRMNAVAEVMPTPEVYAEFTDEAIAARRATLDALAAAYDAKDAEERESERIRLERAELDRQKAEQDAAAQAERDRIAAEEAAAKAKRDEDDRVAREAREAADRAATEARAEEDRKAQAVRDAEEKRLAEERDRLAAEQRRQDDERRQREEQDRVAETARRLVERVRERLADGAAEALRDVQDVVDGDLPDAAAREEIRMICLANLPAKEREAA